MKIKKMLSQHRRDFTATMECEFCKATSLLDSGYDDDFYHQKVIPEMKCKKCLKSTVSEGGEIDNTKTKYPPNQIV